MHPAIFRKDNFTLIVLIYFLIWIGSINAQPLSITQIDATNREDSIITWKKVPFGDTLNIPISFSNLRMIIVTHNDSASTPVYHRIKVLPSQIKWSDVSFSSPDTLSFNLISSQNEILIEAFDTSGRIQHGKVHVIRKGSRLLEYFVSAIVFLIVLSFIIVGVGRKHESEENLEQDYQHLLAENENIIEVINAIIDENIEDVTFNSKIIERKLGLDRIKLSKIVRIETSMPVKDYIKEYRLQKAYILIENGQTDLSEIAQKLGFSSVSFLQTSYEKRFKRRLKTGH